MADLMQLHEDRTSNDDMRETREFVQEWMIFLIAKTQTERHKHGSLQTKAKLFHIHLLPLQQYADRCRRYGRQFVTKWHVIPAKTLQRLKEVRKNWVALIASLNELMHLLHKLIQQWQQHLENFGIPTTSFRYHHISQQRSSDPEHSSFTITQKQLVHLRSLS